MDWHRVLSKALLVRDSEQTPPQQWSLGKLGLWYPSHRGEQLACPELAAEFTSSSLAMLQSHRVTPIFNVLNYFASRYSCALASSFQLATQCSFSKMYFPLLVFPLKAEVGVCLYVQLHFPSHGTAEG